MRLFLWTSDIIDIFSSFIQISTRNVRLWTLKFIFININCIGSQQESKNSNKKYAYLKTLFIILVTNAFLATGSKQCRHVVVPSLQSTLKITEIAGRKRNAVGTCPKGYVGLQHY